MCMKVVGSFFRVIVILFLSATIAVGQAPSSSQNLPSMTPPSPNAMSLGKYGDIPVGLYTGIPNINIPLYTIKVGEYTLPISISYHSQGLKVEENAGWIGLGWSLNAGGMITRTQHGRADDGPGGFWNYPNWTNDSIANLGIGANSFFGGASYDLQPDLFYFNFGSHSGKFIMDATPSHTAHFIPFENYKLTYQINETLSNEITQFQMTDDEGIIYIFGAFETTTDESSETNITPNNTAWYITQIITPGGAIDFTYSTEATFSYQNSEIDYLNTDGSSLDNKFNPGPGGGARYLSNNSVILSSISFPTGVVTFSKAGSRLDFPTASAITGLTVADVNGTLQHKFVFSESYFGNTVTGGTFAVRLKLDSVAEVSLTDGTQKKQYKFAYNSPDLVPSVQSKAQDFWGFYNGQIRNTSLLPALDPIVYGTYIAGQQGSNSGNRTPSASAAQTGVLNTITYPTGGSSTFIYEGNEYGTIAGIQQIQYQTESENKPAGATERGGTNVLTDTVPFTINVAQTVSLSMTGNLYGGPIPDGDGPTLLLQQLIPDAPARTVTSYYDVGGSTTVFPQLVPGNYRLINYVDGPNQSISSNINYYYTDSSIAIRTFPTGGLRIRQIVNADPVSGQTNTKTYHYSSAADPTISSGNLCSPVVYYETQTSNTIGGTTWAMVSSTSLNYLGFTQGSHIGYATVTETDSGTQNIGSKVSFFSATAYVNPPGSVYYMNEPGIINPVRSPGNTPNKYQTDYDVLRGMLTKELTYNATGQLVKQSLINYNVSNGFSTLSPNFFQVNAIAGWTYYMCHHLCAECDCPQDQVCDGCGNYALYNYTLADYSIVCPWIYKTSVIDTAYDINGSNPIGNATYYYYDNPTHGLVTRIVTTDSKGDSLKTVNKYAGDQAQISGLSVNASNALTNLVSINKIAAPIEVDHYNDTTLLNLERTDYLEWYTSPIVVEPQHKWYQVASNPIEDRLDFYQYDTYSNLLEASKAADAHHAYTWDYQHQLVTSEVQNAQVSDIAYTSFEADGTGGWTIGAGSTDATTGLTGSHSFIPTAAISKSGLASTNTYVVSYWTTSTTPYTITGTIAGYPVTGKTVTINGRSWTYYEYKVTGQSTISLTATSNIDELRLYPATAQMQSYTYSPLVGMTSQCDVDNRVTYYEYDGLGRLKDVKDQDGNVIRTIEYHYQGQ
jgi:YD repeat-containing protein